MKTNWKTKKLLITGIPGMGKTTIGNYLQEKYYFQHIDMESPLTLTFGQIIDTAELVVVTWGFVPIKEQIDVVILFKEKGFKLLWLDGDRDAAKREFIKRDSKLGVPRLQVQMEALEQQLERIGISDVITQIKPKIINTFDSFHHFKELEEIIKEIENA